MKLSAWCKKKGLAYQTGWNLFKAGHIPGAYQLPTGTIIVDEQSEVNNKKEEFNVAYARVSSSEQSKTNLETQSKRITDFMEASGKQVHHVIKEVGSGLNDKRKQLNKILMDDRTTAIYVEHSDRLTRFGMEYIKMICELRNIDLVVINDTENDEDDLMKDFVSIITSFCARLYGLRRSKRKTELLINQLKEQ